MKFMTLSRRFGRMQVLASAMALTFLASSGAYSQCNCTCIQVFGFSQTRSWFQSKFESVIKDPDSWQLQYAGGARVDKWTSPSFEGWKAKINSPCKKNSKSPDKALLTVSGNHGTDVGKWKSDTKKYIDVLRQKYPSVKEVILQPVVGDHGKCPVRASRQHAAIQEALEQVASEDSGVRFGFDPHLRSCKDYSDGTGHITKGAQQYISTEIANFYNSFWKGEPSQPNPDPGDPDPVDPGPVDPPSSDGPDFSVDHLKLTFGSDAGEGWQDGTPYMNGGQEFTFSGEVDVAGVANAGPPELYASVVHRAESTDDLTFNFPDVADGAYTLRFHVTDLYGGRAIDILAEGTKVIEDLDPVTEGGGELKAVVKEATVTVSDGNGLQLALTDDRAEPKDVFLSGLEIIAGEKKQTRIAGPAAMNRHVRAKAGVPPTRMFLPSGRAISQYRAPGGIVIGRQGIAQSRRIAVVR